MVLGGESTAGNNEESLSETGWKKERRETRRKTRDSAEKGDAKRQTYQCAKRNREREREQKKFPGAPS